MISPEKKYRTRDGREVRLYAVGCGGACSVHGAILDDDGVWDATKWTTLGRGLAGDGGPAINLIEVKDRHEAWINVPHLEPGQHFAASVWASPEEAERHRSPCHVAVAHVTWEA